MVRTQRCIRISYIDPEARNSKRKLADNRPEESVVVTSLAEEVPKHVVANNDRINEEPKTFDKEFSLREKPSLLANVGQTWGASYKYSTSPKLKHSIIRKTLCLASSYRIILRWKLIHCLFNP